MINYDELRDKRIAVLLSGGVDSSVVVYEFASHGLHPDCFYIKIGPEEQEEWNCSSEEDLEMATAVAKRYGCKLQVIDCHHEYWDQVTKYTMDKVKAYRPESNSFSNGQVLRTPYTVKKARVVMLEMADAMAGIGASQKAEGFMFLPVTAFSMALTTFISQNIGAKKTDRVREGTRFGLLCTAGLLLSFGTVAFFLAPKIVSLFSSDPEIIRYGAAFRKKQCLIKLG